MSEEWKEDQPKKKKGFWAKLFGAKDTEEVEKEESITEEPILNEVSDATEEQIEEAEEKISDVVEEDNVISEDITFEPTEDISKDQIESEAVDVPAIVESTQAEEVAEPVNEFEEFVEPVELQEEIEDVSVVEESREHVVEQIETTPILDESSQESEDLEIVEEETIETEDTEIAEETEEKKGFFAKIAEGLKKTRDAITNKLDALLNSFTTIDDELLEELEETLIMSDVGTVTSLRIVEELRVRIKQTGETDPKNLKGMIRDIVAEMLEGDYELKMNTKPSVVLMIGVNGAGKTTSIGKLAHKFTKEGKNILVAAADTFRAAAIEQLQVWADRSNVDIVKHQEGSDPAAVVYDAIQAGKARGKDLILCDTAGRLHNKKNLMDELAKIRRIIDRELPEADIEALLVLDATTGQNALNQARQFKEVADITGIVLTKLDGTAKGGVVVGIKEELGIPIKFVGVGEQIDDLRPFDPVEFANGLFDMEAGK